MKNFVTVFLFFISIVFIAFTPQANSQVDVTASGGTANASYTTLKGAFDAINAGTHTGTITIGISGNTSETTSDTLRASGTGSASYTSIYISPTGGAARTLSSAAPSGTAYIHFSGADNVTIDGLNSGGNSLTISNTTLSSTTGTSTIKFMEGATNNKITNCTISGSFSGSVATNGGNIFFSTDGTTANGNDNDTISYCNIGPAGSNLPTKGILGNGSTSTTAIGNSGIVIDNNNIYDFFGAAVTSAGVATNGGCNTWTITNNKFYQTATRTWTTGATHTAIAITPSTATHGAQGFTITGNTIGYSSSAGTGTYTLTGSTGKFVGIQFNGITGATVSNINNNTITAVSLSGVTSSGTSTSSPFVSIIINNGLANTNNNTIGSQSVTGSLTFSTNSTSSTHVYGIFNFSVDNWTASNNNIGGISVTNAAASGTYIVYLMLANTSTSSSFIATSNNVGGTVANSIQLSATGASSQVIGMATANAVANWTSNTVRNFTTNIGTGTATGASMIGMMSTTTSTNHTISQNTIYNLSNTHASAASVVTGIQFTSSTGTNTIARNLIYGLTVSTTSASAEVNGIRIAGGTATYKNNMIAIGAGINNAVQVNGITEPSGTNNFYHNSVYIGGSPTAGTGNSFAFNSTVTSNTRSFRDNIFFNARSNSGATGKNYSVRVGGTAPNPAGLTINNNLYYANGSGAVFGFFNSLDVADLAAWKIAVGQDANSFSSNPQYNDPTNATPDVHLHPTNSTVAEGNGFDVGVTDDYDGQTRSGLTPVDIGADAGNFTGVDLSVPAISYSGLSNTSSTSNRSFANVTITDGSGVNTTAGTNPRVYYKTSTNTNAWNDNTSGTDGWKYVEANGSSSPFDFTLDYSKLSGGGGVSANDTLQYFVVAQDLAGTPNVGINSGTFAATPSSVDLTSGAFPLTGTINFYKILGTISGTKTVGASGADYATLTAAVAALNNAELNGPLTINLNADYSSSGETFPITINANPGSSATNTITIKPASGVTATISGTSASSIIKINGADYVTIDGTNATLMPSASRDLTISNTSTATNTAAIWVASIGTGAGSTNVTIKNCNIAAGSNTVTSTFGIFAGGTTIGTSGTGDDNDNLTINNNSVSKAYYGVYARASATGLNNALSVTQNSIGSSTATDYIGKYGLDITQTTGSDLSQNTIFNFIGTNTNPTGMLLGMGVVSTTITRNDIHSLRYTGTSGYGGKGIDINTGSASSSVTIANNVIYDLLGDGWNAFSSDAIVGVRILGTTGGLNIYYNSINLSGTADRSGTATTSAALYVVSTATTLNVKNNIFANSIVNSTNAGAKAYTIFSDAANTAYTSINNNDYYPGGTQGVLGYLGADKTTLSAWQTATGQDANSVSGDPKFTSSSNLHINTTIAGSAASNVGTSIGAVTNDFDGDSRDGSIPDIGADEFSYPVPQAFTLTSPTGAGQGVSGTISWETSANAIRYDVLLDTVSPPVTVLASNVSGASTGYSGLLPSTTYYWEVYAEGADSANGGYLKSTNGPLSFTTVTPPEDPGGLMLSNVTKDSVFLSWTDNADDGPNQDSGFVVYRKAGSAPSVGSGSPDSVAAVAALAGTGTATYQDFGLSPNLRYYYRVSARNANGESNYTGADTTTLAATPAAPTASNAGFTSMQLTLAAPAPNPASTQFAIRVIYTSAASSLPITKYIHTNGTLVDTAVWGTYANFGSASGLTVTGLTMSKDYFYDVKARNENNYETAFGDNTWLSTLSPYSTFPYTNDFEGSGDEGWSSGIVDGSVNNWVRGTPAKAQITGAHGGTKAWVTKSTASYDNDHDAALYSPYFSFSALTEDPTVLFWHNFKTEVSLGYDVGILEYSSDGGASWRRVDSVLGTGGNFTTANSYNWYNNSTTRSGSPAIPNYSGTSTSFAGNAGGYIQSTTKLVGLAGQENVQLRWRFFSEGSAVSDGWAIDDVKIAVDVTAPTIAYSSLSNTTNTGTRQLTAVIKGGVDVRTAGAPRIYYKKNAAGSYYASQASSIADTMFTFDIDPANIGSVTTGDTVLYYVAAQDSNGNPATYPSGSGLTTDPPNGVVAAPSYYIIVGAPLSGDYTVGLTLFNKISGKELTLEKRTRKVTIEVPDFSIDEKMAKSPEFSSVRLIPPPGTKRVEVEEEYYVPMENGKEYEGSLLAEDMQGITSGAYPTITAAVSDLVLRGVSGAVRLLLIDASYTGETLPITINAITGASAVNTVTIQPNTGVTSSVSGSSAVALFKLNGADYVIIDGSNSGGTDRNLTLNNTSTGTSSAVVWIGSAVADGATNNTIKNCVITGNASTTTAVGVFSGSGTTIYGFSAAANSSNTIENNVITKSQDAIVFLGMSTTTLDQNTIVRNNVIGAATAGDGFSVSGITGYYQQEMMITGNDVQNVVGASSYDMYGIDLEESKSSTVSANKVHFMNYNGSSTNKVNGITTASPSFNTSGNSSMNTFANNMVYDLLSSNTSGLYSVSGINNNGGYGDAYYFNSVYLTGSMGTSTSGHSFAFSNGNPLVSTSGSNITLRDNIFYNKGTSTVAAKEYAIYTTQTSLSGSVFDNNDYIANATAPATSVLGYYNADRVNLTAWKSATGSDANSISADPMFLSATNLHIDNGSGVYSPAGNVGTTVAGVTTDIDADTRSSTPDIGADEFTLPPPGSFALLSPTGASQPVVVTLVWNRATGASRYDVYVETNDPPMVLAANNVADTQYTFSGDPSTTYFWQVYAETHDSAGSRTISSNGPLSFETVAAPNSPGDLTLTTGINTLAASLKNRINDLKQRLVSGAVKDKKEYLAIEEEMESLHQQLLATAFVNASWTDNSANEENFYVYRKAGSEPEIGSPFTDRIAIVSANPGSGGTMNYNDSPVNLNTRYYYRVTAVNESGVESGFASADTTTLAATPGVPTFTEVEWSRMNIILNTATNSAATEFAILDSASGMYVSVAGTISSGSEVWQTYAQWGGASGQELSGLSRGTLYSFTVKARNGNGIETGFGGAGRQRTTYDQQSIALNEGFESPTFPPTDWQAVELDGGSNTWVRSTAIPRTGTASAAVRYESSLLSDDWLISPLVKVPTIGGTLSFYYRAESPSFIDSFEVWMSPQANGSTPAQFLSGGTLLYNNTDNNFGTYQSHSIDLSAYAGQNVYLAWHYDAYDQFRLYLDDVLLAGKNPANTITVKKQIDGDGTMATTGDRSARNWGLSLHADSATGMVLGSVSSDTVLVVPNLLDGTYYSVEADSAGWTHLGYTLNGAPTTSGANVVPVTVTGGGQNAMLTFINFSPNTIILRKYVDTDVDFGTTGDRTKKSWYLALYRDSVSPSSLVASGATDSLFTDNLGAGTYIAMEADSAGWSVLGHVVDGAPVASASRYDTISVSGNTTTMVDFVNGQSGSITVRKYRDVNGGSPTKDEARAWFLAVRSGSCSGAIVASGNATSVTASGLAPGTYYVTEADSAGWEQVGYILDDTTFINDTTGCVIVAISGGESRTVDFANRRPNTITIRKYRDTNGGTPSFDTQINWGFSVKDDEEDVVDEGSGTAFVVMSLNDGTYSACEADSQFWTTVGYRIDGGAPVASELQCVSFSVADGQSITIDFVNMLLDTTRFYSVIADSFALTKDPKGALKSIKKKADKVQFTATVKPDSNNVNDLHLEFGVEIDTTHYEFTITPAPATLLPDPKSKLKKWNATFSAALDSDDVVTISGYGQKGMKQKISSYWWNRNSAIVGKKKSKGATVEYTLRLPMPNVHNLGEETFAQGAFPGKDGMIVGVPHLEAPGAYAWVTQKKYADVQKSLVKKVKTGYLVHDGTGRCFDFFKTGKFLVKKQTSLPPDKYDNKLFGDLIALKLNIAASALNKTPIGFGELKYKDAGNLLDGLMVKEIAAIADTLLTNCATRIAGLDPADLTNVISNINGAFAAPLDTASWSSKLVVKPVIHLSDVGFLVRDPSISPATIIPLENEIAQMPEKYELYQNFPNPFNPSTTISFDLPEASKVTLIVYNLLGQVVMTVYDGAEMESGAQEIVVNALNLPTGVYFYRLHAQSLDEELGTSFTGTKKFMLVK